MSSGSSKLIIQKIEVKDRQGLVGEAPGLEPGMVVSAWNPDESWAQDALLRVNATKGVPTAELTVWSLVDVMVHPLGVHIHQQVANGLWVSQHCLIRCHLLCQMPAHAFKSITTSAVCRKMRLLGFCHTTKLRLNQLLQLQSNHTMLRWAPSEKAIVWSVMVHLLGVHTHQHFAPNVSVSHGIRAGYYEPHVGTRALQLMV